MITTSLYKTKMTYRGKQYVNTNINQLFEVIIQDMKKDRKYGLDPNRLFTKELEVTFNLLGLEQRARTSWIIPATKQIIYLPMEADTIFYLGIPYSAKTIPKLLEVITSTIKAAKSKV